MRSTRLPSWIRRLGGLEAVAGPPFVFALTEDSIRYGDFPRVGGSVQLREFHQVKLRDRTFGSGVLGPTLQEEGSLRAALEDLLSRIETVPSEASLVVPDSWLRLTFAELENLPRAKKEREEVLRWRLKSLVPFKVDELRLRAVEIEGSPDEASATRTVLLAFGAETLLRGLEASFSSYGIRLGRISNVSLSLLEAVREAGEQDGIQAVVSVDDRSYTIVFAAAGRPIIYRHKLIGEGASSSSIGGLVRRELRLTRTFVKRRLGSTPADIHVFLFAAAEDEERWRGWLTEELAAGEVRTGSELLPAGGRPAAGEAIRVVPMMGAAGAMVS